ncbi:MAG: glutathione peroxidase [Myxococcota bacterium]|jgi:glutathione peroxidase|nr:glutathione peroxidase [Myxococcota bacterium]
MSIYDFSVKTLQGEERSMRDYAGKVLLIVNTASKCGFTKQYEGLQKLHERYAERGLVVLGFPCNQFGSQEPGNAQEIASFCRLDYGVSFDMFEKVEVNGKNAHPLWRFLRSEAPGLLGSTGIKWNFTKFLVARDGTVRSRHAPQTAPDALSSELEALLAEGV